MRLLAPQLPQSGFEDFQAGAAPGLVGKQFQSLMVCE